MADDATDALVDEWGIDNVRAAFWLQSHIKRNGLDGIGYMAEARSHLESTKHITTKSKIRGALKSSY